MFCITNAKSQTLLNCNEFRGHSFYPYQGIIAPEKSGWQVDGITNGKYTLTKIGQNEFDILYTDATQTVKSTSQDGGAIMLLSISEVEMTFLVNYPNKIVETFYFYKNKKGSYELLLTQVKYGTEIKRSTILKASCSRIE